MGQFGRILTGARLIAWVGDRRSAIGKDGSDEPAVLEPDDAAPGSGIRLGVGHLDNGGPFLVQLLEQFHTAIEWPAMSRTGPPLRLPPPTRSTLGPTLERRAFRPVTKSSGPYVSGDVLQRMEAG